MRLYKFLSNEFNERKNTRFLLSLIVIRNSSHIFEKDFAKK